MTRRQEQILDEIGKIALAEGFAHLRVADLAERLHCSRATLYDLAPTKEALFARSFDRIADAWIAYANQQTRLAPPGPERIATYAESIARCQAAAVPQLWKDAQAYPLTLAVLMERSAESSRDYKGYLEEAVTEGSVRELNPPYVAELILAGARITRDARFLEASGLTADEAMRELARFIRGGVGKPAD